MPVIGESTILSQLVISDQVMVLGDCLHVLPKLPSKFASAVVTDPPYGIRFMGQEWDHGVQWWKLTVG